jgi:hypothetical protein
VCWSRLSRVVSARRGAIIEGEATVGDVGILYRAVLLPLSEDGAVVDQVAGRSELPPAAPRRSADDAGHFPDAMALTAGVSWPTAQAAAGMSAWAGASLAISTPEG